MLPEQDGVPQLPQEPQDGTHYTVQPVHQLAVIAVGRSDRAQELRREVPHARDSAELLLSSVPGADLLRVRDVRLAQGTPHRPPQKGIRPALRKDSVAAGCHQEAHEGQRAVHQGGTAAWSRPSQGKGTPAHRDPIEHAVLPAQDSERGVQLGEVPRGIPVIHQRGTRKNRRGRKEPETEARGSEQAV